MVGVSILPHSRQEWDVFVGVHKGNGIGVIYLRMRAWLAKNISVYHKAAP